MLHARGLAETIAFGTTALRFGFDAASSADGIKPVRETA
jgi:hypothetical protein